MMQRFKGGRGGRGWRRIDITKGYLVNPSHDFHLHFGEREDENVNGEILKAEKRESTYAMVHGSFITYFYKKFAVKT